MFGVLNLPIINVKCRKTKRKEREQNEVDQQDDVEQPFGIVQRAFIVLMMNASQNQWSQPSHLCAISIGQIVYLPPFLL